MKTFISAISKQEFPIEEEVLVSSIRKPIFDLIRSDHNGINRKDSISLSELNYYREKYISGYLINNLDELSELRNNVLNAVKKHALISDKLESDDKGALTIGQRIADKVAYFGGSWTFIISFLCFLGLWITVNVVLALKAFDPFPFILLNLILSCIAALQAPVIMMSQNRQEQKDRERSQKDYMINLKSELEIQMLHEKIDHLIMHQQQELIEIQKVQIDMMNDILTKMKN